MSLEYYASQDASTDPGAFADLYDDLPHAPSELRDLVSRLIVHADWAAMYGIPPDVPMSRDTQAVAGRLKLIQASLAGSPLTGHHPLEKRTSGTCRDYSLMLCSMLRHRSIQARVRCGFATYFTAGHYEDHWICEYWSPDAMRWVRTDAQLDHVFRKRFAIDFDCADLPDAAFLSAAQAWRLARSGGARSEAFGHGDATGFWFLRVNVYRDLLVLVG